MFYIPFWIFIAVVVIFAAITIYARKLHFVDIQVMILVIAVSMTCDMIFCKQLELYHYVNVENKGWYSFWANFVACPAMGLIFIKFAPYLKKRAVLYIAVWSSFFTLLELFILKPYGILHTPDWHTIPWSPIGYFLVLTLEYIDFRILENRIR